jgi:hypothetical protein
MVSRFNSSYFERKEYWFNEVGTVAVVDQSGIRYPAVDSKKLIIVELILIISHWMN